MSVFFCGVLYRLFIDKICLIATSGEYDFADYLLLIICVFNRFTYKITLIIGYKLSIINYFSIFVS